jgi:hypothetical protein
MATTVPNPLDDVGDPNRPEATTGDPVAPQGSDITKDAGIPTYLADEQPGTESGFPTEPPPSTAPTILGGDGLPQYLQDEINDWVMAHTHEEVEAIQGQDAEARLRVQQADDAAAAGVANLPDYEKAVDAVTVAPPPVVTP